MAAQTDAPDDLIAELARLMADDARSDQAARPEQPAQVKPTVRIPGGDAPSPVGQAPRFDFSTSAPPAQPKPVASTIVRIPGGDQEATKTVEAAPEPFRFDLGIDIAKKPAGPTTPLPSAEPAAPVQPAQPEEPTELDHDSLADLIAAELANDMAGDQQSAKPAPAVAKTEDNFGVPPVFGLGAPVPEARMPEQPPAVVVKPEPVPAPVVASVAPAVAKPTPVSLGPQHSDPLSDIERLVGPAVNMSREEAPRAPSPALRSLATPTIPTPEPVAPAERGAPASSEPGSVDDAILAAAAATGARVEWVDPDFDGAQPAAEPQPRAQRQPVRVSRAVIGPLVALGLLGIAGFGLYWMLGQGPAPTGPAPLLVADSTEIKDVPEPVTATPQQSIVFNEISGASPPEDEQIVSRDQADVAAVAEAESASAVPPSTNPGGNSGVIATGDQADIDPNQTGLVNRKVRTVTVRPDGTIVSSDDSMAGATILPVDRPAVPDVPGADFSTPDIIADTLASESTAAAAAAATPDPAVPATPAVPLVQPGSQAQVVDSTGAAMTGRTVTIPMQRPADFASAATSALAAAAVPASTPAATPAPATSTNTLPPAPTQAAAPAATPAPAAATSGTAGAYAQLSSQRSEQAARETAQALATRFGVLFGGANLEIQRADLGERGVYYRVVVPSATRDSAANICTQVRAAGGDCILL